MRIDVLLAVMLVVNRISCQTTNGPNSSFSLTIGLVMPWETNMGWQRTAAGASIGLDTARAAGYLLNANIR